MCSVLNDVLKSRINSDDLESICERGRDMDLGETFTDLPRVTSTHSLVTYGNLLRAADNLDFRQEIFRYRAKRNRSIGSAQAFIVELALADREFRERLKKYMIAGGKGFMYESDYIDRYV